MKTVVVIGGGITGVSALYELQKWKKKTASNVRLILAEANEELGGKIRSVHDGDFIMESGADSIVARKGYIGPLIEELGIQEEVVYNATGRSFIHNEGELKLIPEEAVFGIPTSIESLAKTTLVSAEGKVAALKDFYTKNEAFTAHDSIGDFLECFLGKELVEKQIAPVLSGVYSGKLADLTIASTLPYLLDYKNEYGSIIKGLSENKKAFQGNGDKKFLSFKSGLSTLLDRMEEQMEDVEIRKGTEVKAVTKTGSTYTVTFVNGESIIADYIILSIPYNATQKLLENPALQKEFDQLKNSSLISVYVGFDLADSELPKDGTGFITAGTSALTCNACTWTSRKWEHTSKKNLLLIRLFYKSTNPAFATLQTATEEELLKVALRDIEVSLGISGIPVTSEVTNWSNMMPNYHIHHRKVVQRLEEKLEQDFPGIRLAGCSYYGVGIPDCIGNGEATAKWVIEQL
ncbi:protoporphyrinogen oxidase [Peribacillus huizhouensis]|uniref:Coproporphyrinogen III oxidase n=1 Tax=Peribacillus huizhouensis TaxID=1501239 RepID=A0ABR6CUY8_9BACI|nr:protoporphyrinogen oxidase [Peribacillus huizhouensis]MBA9028779.1 oxygen-dependent protoporphyrinogen oxidase [Peribacillus huizhouensis]